MHYPITRCVLSGTYRKDQDGLRLAYEELARLGCQILSPHRLQFEESNAEFVKDIAERSETMQIIEEHHLRAIKQADFVWLHAPQGYIGVSTAMEIGFAYALNIPVFSVYSPQDKLIALFVDKVPSVFVAINKLQI